MRVKRSKDLLEVNYTYAGLFGGVLWAAILLVTKIQAALFPQVFIITLLIIAFNIIHSRNLMRAGNISLVNKTLTAVINVSFITALIYYTGGAESGLWVTFLLAIASFSLIYTKFEMLLATAFVGAVYSILYLMKIDSLQLLPVTAGGLAPKIIFLFFIAFALKAAVNYHVEHQRLIDEIDEVKYRMLHAQKMAVLGQIVSGVMHELNTPITAVLGYSQLLLESADNEEMKTDLKLVNDNAVRCKKIVDSLLEFSRKRKYVDNCVDINRVLEETIGLLDHMIELEKVELRYRADKYLPKVFADPYKLQQVFVNLINNSCQSMMSCNGRRKLLEISAEKLNGSIRIEFRDNGQGIPEDVMPFIFEPFFTTRKEGTGLGLSICKDIIGAYKGRICAANNVDAGASFVIELPLPQHGNAAS